MRHDRVALHLASASGADHSAEIRLRPAEHSVDCLQTQEPLILSCGWAGFAIATTIPSFIALGPAANEGQGMARGPAGSPGAFRPAGLDHDARAPLFGICPPRIRLSSDFLLTEWPRLTDRGSDRSEDDIELAWRRYSRCSELTARSSGNPR